MIQKLWRKLFPVRTVTVVTQGSPVVVMERMGHDLVIATQRGKLKILRYDHITEDYKIINIGYID